MERQKMSLGEFIAKRRKQMLMTQEILAERMHVSKSAVAKWETDGGIPDRDNLKNLADVLEIKVDDLHRIISGEDKYAKPIEQSIISDVLAVFEDYGYLVIHPGHRTSMSDSCKKGADER